MWRHQKSCFICVRQVLNTRRSLVNALVTWHVSYKITTLCVIHNIHFAGILFRWKRWDPRTYFLLTYFLSFRLCGMLFPPPFSSLELGFEEKKVPSVLTHFLQEKDHDTIMQSCFILKRGAKENLSDPNSHFLTHLNHKVPRKAEIFGFSKFWLRKCCWTIV